MLGVGRSADRETIRRAYLELARRHHPDRPGGDPETMRAVNQAWATLGDPVRRARYDRTLAPTTPPAPPTPDRSAPSTPRFARDSRYPAHEEAELEAERWEVDADDRPLHLEVELPRWARLLPTAAFAASIGAGVLGVVMTSEPLLALAGMFLVLSVLFFLSAPFLALLGSRRPPRDED